jgi:hypothetical protein
MSSNRLPSGSRKQIDNVGTPAPRRDGPAMIWIPWAHSRSAALSILPDQRRQRSDSGASSNEFEAVARLVDTEQRAAHRDLAYPAPPIRRVVQMGAGTEQAIAEGAGRFEVGGGEGDVVDPQDVRHEWSPAMARRVWTERRALRPTADLMRDVINCDLTLFFGHHCSTTNCRAARQCRNETIRKTPRSDGRTVLRIGRKSHFP